MGLRVRVRTGLATAFCVVAVIAGSLAGDARVGYYTVSGSCGIWTPFEHAPASMAI